MEQPFGRSGGAGGQTTVASRISAAFDVLHLEWQLHRLSRAEKDALIDAGAAILAAPVEDGRTPDVEEAAMRARAVVIESKAGSLDKLLADKLETDRRDYAEASPLTRWLVVGRSYFDRWIAYDEVRQGRKERRAMALKIGTRAFAGESVLHALVPQDLADKVESVRAEQVAKRGQRDALNAAYQGSAIPRPLVAVGREIGVFFAFVAKQLKLRIFLRAPAVAALFAGWWVGRTYTDSVVERFQRALGLGGRKPIDPDTLQTLQFWIPLLAAAACAYLMAFVALRVHRRFGVYCKTGSKT